MGKTAEVVKLTTLGSRTREKYSDGDAVEGYLLELFRRGLTDSQRRQILAEQPSWPIRYHLAYERGNLLSWYPFNDDAAVLEVGAGCGSITEVLVANKTLRVTSNELSPRRAKINALRNKGAKNLEIIIGNLFDYKPAEKFDYVVCVGVFEYAKSFIETANPYYDFLVTLRQFLKPGGTLLLAIENQLGMKYLAGAREDHTGNYMDGINDYPGTKGVRTFGRHELIKLLEATGYGSTYFYYPFPDYKLPREVFSDDYYPGKDDVSLSGASLPTPSPETSRHYVFSEKNLMRVLERNGLFPSLANSFLVEVLTG
jgi:2-polyprenyl-3-methyl-5-hydroxy-6-metoxy-1,4-benzoquinol methylase